MYLYVLTFIIKYYQGGNDYEIYSHDKVIGHAVTSPEDTITQLEELFKI